MLWYILNGLYLIIWSVLLIDCLLRSQFYPIFGRGRGTKIFWLLTFVFFNPLLTLLYIIFLVLLLYPKVNKNSKWAVYGSVAAVVYACVVLVLFNIPLGKLKMEPSVILSSSEKKSSKDNNSFLNFRKDIALGYINSKNKAQTLSSASPGQNSRISLRNVMLICQSPYRMLDRTAREFQSALVALPYIDEVSYYSYGTFPKQGGLVPDVIITIAMPEFAENKFMYSRNLQAMIKWKASSSMFEEMSDLTSSLNDNPVIQFNITSEINYGSTMIGIESPEAEYRLEAKNISNEMTTAIRKQLENLLVNYKELPELPDFLFGNYSEPPEFSFLKKESSVQLFSGNGLLKDNCTIWIFKDKRETSKALIEYSDEMKNMGWKEEKRGDEYLCMRKNYERMHIFRQSHRDMFAGPILKDHSPHTSMIAYYESNFSDERLEKIIDELVKSKADIKTLLIFEKYFKTPEQKKLLCSMIEQDPTSSLNGNLVLCQYWIDQGEMDKAREALIFARAMQLSEKKDNIKAQEIENLAEKLGDESLIEMPLDMDVLRNKGFVNLDEINNEPLVFERGLDEPLFLYRSLENGQLQTLALHVIKSVEPSFSMPYRLLTVEKKQGRSSSSETEGRLGTDKSWIAESSLHDFTDEDEPIYLNIKSFGNERFLFTIIKGQQV